MHVRVPFTYLVAGTPKGGRKLDPLTFGAWTDVDLREIDAAEAPVAMSWQAMLGGGGQETRTARWDGSDLWTELGAPETSPSPGFTPASVDDIAGLERRYFRDYRGASLAQAIAEITGEEAAELRAFAAGMLDMAEMDPSAMRTVAWSGRQEAEQRTRDAFEGVAVIDGRLWRKGGEPFYEIHPAGMGWSSRAVRASVVVCQPHTRPSPVRYWTRFRADRPDDAADWAREASAGADPFVFGRIEVSIPEAVRFDDEGESVLRAASECLKSGHGMLMAGGRERVMAWADLKEELDTGRPDPEILAERLRGLAASFPETSDVSRTASHALRRWDIRPMSGFGMEF